MRTGRKKRLDVMVLILWCFRCCDSFNGEPGAPVCEPNKKNSSDYYERDQNSLRDVKA